MPKPSPIVLCFPNTIPYINYPPGTSFSRHCSDSSSLLSFPLYSWSQDGADVDADANADIAPVFRVCADPNNLPFSNEEQEGFENKIAQLFAPNSWQPAALYLVATAARILTWHLKCRAL